MTSKMPKNSIVTDFISCDDVVTIGATTPTGFEFVAVRELKAKLDIIEMERIQGKIFFRTTISCLPRIHQLKSVDNLFIVVKYFPEYVYNEDKETAIKDLLHSITDGQQCGGGRTSRTSGSRPLPVCSHAKSRSRVPEEPASITPAKRLWDMSCALRLLV